MQYFRLNPQRGSQFRRYKPVDGQAPKALIFEPGRITGVQDEDADALQAEDLHPNCLTEVTDEALLAQRGFAHANPADAPVAVATEESETGADAGSEAAANADDGKATAAAKKKKPGGKKKKASQEAAAETPAAANPEEN